MKKIRIDFGATKCKYIIEDKTISIYEEISSSKLDPSVFVEKKLKEHPDIKYVNVSFAGQVQNGKILSAPNISIKRKNIKVYIEKNYDVKFAIENDLKCAALAEYHMRKRTRTLFAAYIGTGFGGAIIEDGKIIKGHSNIAGEIGHIPFKKAPFKCGCGKDDCIEIYCSGIALKRWVEYYGLDCDPTLVSIESQQNEKSTEILNNFYEALSYSLSTIITIVNPTYLVLGGSVVLNNQGLANYVKESIRRHAFGPAAIDVNVEISNLENGCLEGTKWL